MKSGRLTFQKVIIVDLLDFIGSLVDNASQKEEIQLTDG
jgi:hypothetical protein